MVISFYPASAGFLFYLVNGKTKKIPPKQFNLFWRYFYDSFKTRLFKRVMAFIIN